MSSEYFVVPDVLCISIGLSTTFIMELAVAQEHFVFSVGYTDFWGADSSQ